jgi:DNA polymerase III delta subunit
MLDKALAGGARDLDLTVLRPGEDPLASAGAALAQVGMFSGGRCLWIRGFDESADDAHEVLDLLTAGIPAESTLLVTARALDQRSRLFKWFAANGNVEDLRIARDKRGQMLDEEVEQFIRKRLEEQGIRTSTQVVALIRQRAGNEIGSLAQELDKLALAADESGNLTAADVRAHVRDQNEAWVFDLTNAISERSLDRAVTLLERLLAQGEPPIRLVAVLATHIADLIEAARVLPSFPRTRNAGAFARDYFPKLPVEFRNRFKSAFRAFYVLQGAAAFTLDELRRSTRLCCASTSRSRARVWRPSTCSSRLSSELARVARTERTFLESVQSCATVSRSSVGLRALLRVRSG